MPSSCRRRTRKLAPAVIDLLSSYQIERDIRRDRDELPNHLKREVTLTPEFKALWDRIKPKTTYRVEFDTEVLARRAVDGVKRMPAVEKSRIRVTAGRLSVEKGGVAATASSSAEERVEHAGQPIPDVLAYLQNETELYALDTLARILRESGRLGELFNNPQHFLDAVAAILNTSCTGCWLTGSSTSASAAAGPRRSGRCCSSRTRSWSTT